MRPGPLRLSVENRATCACCRRCGSPAHTLHDLLGKRRPFLTAKRLLTNQTFRDIYRTDTLDVDQGLKITSLTFLFTDLKGSTALYDRVGDLAAYDLVREHFRVLNEIVASEAGAVVKTIGDAVMATFPTPDRALAAALRMRASVRDIRDGDLLIKIGIHEGPCLAVTLNDRLDYFGQTVNIAARVQGLADAKAIFATKPVVDHPQVAKLIEQNKLDADRAARGAARRQRQDGGVSVRSPKSSGRVEHRSLPGSWRVGPDGRLATSSSSRRTARTPRWRDRSCARPNAGRPASARPAGRPTCRTEC